ncbi:MAG: nucleotidyltransferase domain-containing protein [Blastocatellia bacterium]
MSKQTANGISAIKPARVKAAAAPKKRSAKARTAMPMDADTLTRQYQEWHQSFKTPAKRCAYIRKICRRIAEEIKPEKIILFGSHAYGRPTRESDLDLLVVMPYEGSPLAQAVKIGRQLNLMIPMDLLVRTREQVATRLAMDDFFMREILERGKVMYEAHGLPL